MQQDRDTVEPTGKRKTDNKNKRVTVLWEVSYTSPLYEKRQSAAFRDQGDAVAYYHEKEQQGRENVQMHKLITTRERERIF